MVKCKHARKMLADYVNEALGAEESRLVQEHVADCNSCRHDLEMLTKVINLVDDIKVEYPPVHVWGNFLPDLRNRIESEAALTFRKHQKQRLYLFPGWIASAATIVLIILIAAIMKYSPSYSPIRIQKAKSTEKSTGIVGVTSTNIVEYGSERMLVAEVISKVLITESEAKELRDLGSFISSGTFKPSYHYYYDALTDISTDIGDMGKDKNNMENEEELIEFLLENEFSEFDRVTDIESNLDELWKM